MSSTQVRVKSENKATHNTLNDSDVQCLGTPEKVVISLLDDTQAIAETMFETDVANLKANRHCLLDDLLNDSESPSSQLMRSQLQSTTSQSQRTTSRMQPTTSQENEV